MLQFLANNAINAPTITSNKHVLQSTLSKTDTFGPASAVRLTAVSGL